MNGEPGVFHSIGGQCGWWSSTESNDYAAHMCKLLESDAEFNMYKFHKGFGLYIRCIKD